MKLNMLFFALFLSLFFTNSLIFAQTISDSLFVTSVANRTANRYLNRLESEKTIFNGKEYHPDNKLDDNGHTLFIKDQFVQGSITYDGNKYEDVYIKYDLVKNQLVLLNYDGIGGIILMSNHVDSFFLNDHTFINLKPKKTTGKQIEPGYYDLLYNGSIKLFAKRKKKIAEVINQYKVLRMVEEQETYFLFKNDEYFPLKGKRSLLKSLNSTNLNTQKYINLKGLNFRKNKENAMIELLKFYDLRWR